MPPSSSLRVLVVDDQESMRWIVIDLLKRMGIISVAQAGSKKDAMLRMTEHRFDLVLSDHNMDNGSGLDFLRAVRGHPLFKRTPFIMITGNSDAETVSSVVRAGVNNYIVKPVSFDTLKKKMEQVLGALT